jgi:hypothetical protein
VAAQEPLNMLQRLLGCLRKPFSLPNRLFFHAGQRENISFIHAEMTFFNVGITFFHAGGCRVKKCNFCVEKSTFFHARATFFHAENTFFHAVEKVMISRIWMFRSGGELN